MRVHGIHYRTIALGDDGESVTVIDQTKLPFAFEQVHLRTADDAAVAIQDMIVRGAPLIGVTAAYGVALGLRADAGDGRLDVVVQQLGATRPTAVNLRWALTRMVEALRDVPVARRVEAAYAEAARIADEDAAACEAIGRHGAVLLKLLSGRHDGRPLNVLTHCNAGWLATVDWGTALAPVYAAHALGIPLHVYVDETRPRNQGASLTAFELGAHGVPHTVIADNAGGHLMQHGRVDVCIVGSDRTTATGDVCNKIGTYLKALAARAHGIPFYVALPVSSIDWTIREGLREIPIEERSADEVRGISGRLADGRIERVELFGPETSARNPAFDVTPATYVTGFVTEYGVFDATADALTTLKWKVEDGRGGGR